MWWLAVGVAVICTLAVVLLLVWQCSSASDSPFVNLYKYAFPHDDFVVDPPGKGTHYTKATLKSSTSGRVLRMYYTHPSSARFKWARGVLVWCHDFGTHQGRYSLLAQRFSEAGFAVYGIDFQGHGESEGDRWVIEDFRLYVSDVMQLCTDVVRHKYRTPPLFLGGEGVGGTIALLVSLYANQLSAAGLVMLAPFVTPPVTGARAFWARLLTKLSPRSLVPFRQPDQYSRNYAVVREMEEDKAVLSSGMVTAVTMNQLVQLSDLVHKTLPWVTLPFHIQHGLRDLVFDPQGARLLFRSTVQVPPMAKTLVWYHHSWHSLVQEMEAEEVVQMAIDWVEEHLRCLDLAKTLD